MIKSVTVINHFGESLKLELTKPEQSGFLIKNIDGLGPGKATINTSKNATHGGTRFNSAFSNQRSIVISLMFIQNDTEDIEDLRHKTYRYFPKEYEVELIVETDKRTSSIKGWVESNEPEIFSSAEGCSITLVCPDPYFYSTSTREVLFYGTEPTFEFPLENDSVTDPLLEMGVIKSKNEETVYYEGDCTIGIDIMIHVIGEASNITIYNTQTRELMNINYDFIAGDTVFVNTHIGSKGIMLLRDGVRTNILNCLGRSPDWFTIVKGDNIFAYTADTGIDNLQFRICHKVAYDGV